MSNIVIIGSGPAGVSAALYTARAGVDTTVLTRGPGALDRAELIQNYYGFAAPISGAELERQGIEGAKAVGVKFVTTEAVGLTYTDKLTVETLDGDYPADAVVLATGASRATPRIPGLAGLEGHGVSYCATCDAFFYRGKDVAVVGSGEYALHEVQALLPVAASVTLLLNGAPPAAEFPPEVAVRPEKIDAILGEQKVTGVQLSGGDVVELACNLDDMTGEGIAFARERLLAAGALDVYTLPIGMKKSRPGVMLCVLCREEQREAMVHLLLRHTTTLGVRETRHRRYTLSRSQDTVDSPWGPVARKTSQGWGVRRQKPEFEDLARIAREQDLTLDQVRDGLK